MVLAAWILLRTISGKVTEIPSVSIRVTPANLIPLVVTAFIFLLISIHRLKLEREGRLRTSLHDLTMGLLLCGITGLSCTNDLLTTFFFIELVSGCCLVLVLDARDKPVLGATFMYGIVVAISSIFYLLGLIVVYQLTGTTNLSIIMETTALTTVVQENPKIFLFAIACFTIAFFAKIGFFPFHGWMPGVYAAAKPPVIGTFSAKTMVLFHSFHSIVLPLTSILQSTTMNAIIVVMGMVSMFFGALNAFAQKDFMRMLAYCQVYMSGLAACTLFLTDPASLGTMNTVSGFFYVVNGALMKVGLIMILNAVYQAKQTKNMEMIGGFIEKRKILALCYVVIIFSLAGIPPTSGFFAKWLVYNTVYTTVASTIGPVPGIAMLVFMSCMAIVEIMALLRSFHMIFMGKSRDLVPEAHARAGTWVLPAVIAAIAIILGLQPCL